MGESIDSIVGDQSLGEPVLAEMPRVWYVKETPYRPSLKAQQAILISLPLDIAVEAANLHILASGEGRRSYAWGVRGYVAALRGDGLGIEHKGYFDPSTARSLEESIIDRHGSAPVARFLAGGRYARGDVFREEAGRWTHLPLGKLEADLKRHVEKYRP